MLSVYMGCSVVSFYLKNFSYASSFNWQVAQLSLQTGFMSEYTRMIILEDDQLKKVKESSGTKVCVKIFEFFFTKLDIKQCFHLRFCVFNHNLSFENQFSVIESLRYIPL